MSIHDASQPRVRILVGVDFSASSNQAYRSVLNLAHHLGAHLEVVHIAPSTGEAPLERLSKDDDPSRELAFAEEHLVEHCLQAAARAVTAHAHLRQGRPVAGLLEAIHDLRPDLVAIGSHGQNALARALLGTVSEELWRRSPVPVLVIPPRRHDAQATPPGPSAPAAIPWSCSRCGHVRGPLEAAARCGRCGAAPASWDWSAIFTDAGPLIEAALGAPPRP